MRENKKRIFVAAVATGDVRRRIEKFAVPLRQKFAHIRIGWERPEKLHLTLKFLGDVEEARIEQLREAVRNTARRCGPLSLILRGTGCFPSRSKAKVLWLGLQDESGGLAKLVENLETEAEAFGFEREQRMFKSHLTIARLREPERSRALVDSFLQAEFEPAGFEVSELVIYESKLQLAGSIYTAIAREKLFPG